MSGKVTIRLETDPACRETEVIIRSSRHTQLTESIISAVERCVEREYPPVAAYQGDMLVLIAQNDIARICTENRKLTIFAASGRFVGHGDHGSHLVAGSKDGLQLGGGELRGSEIDDPHGGERLKWLVLTRKRPDSCESGLL